MWLLAAAGVFIPQIWQEQDTSQMARVGADQSCGSRTADTNERFPSVKIYVAKSMGSQLFVQPLAQRNHAYNRNLAHCCNIEIHYKNLCLHR